jgi:hypothetical protein
VNEGIKIKLANSADTFSIIFDQVLRTESGTIMAVEMVPRLGQVNVTLEHGIKININKLHFLLGHACEVAKARQRNVLKETVTLE